MMLRVTNSEKIKYLAGLLLAKLLPQRTAQIRNTFTIPNFCQDYPSGRISDRLIRSYLGYQAKKAEAKIPGELEAIHRNFWSKTEEYFFVTGDRTENIYIPAYGDIVLKLEKLLIERNIQHVYEFGSGDGKWLNYLSQQWLRITELNSMTFAGIDLSDYQVNRNNEIYNHLEFISADLVVWTEKNATPNSLYHTNSGVLEYLSQDSVEGLMQTLKSRARNSLIFFIEPLYGSYDLEEEVASRIIGHEHSYTHNYIYLLKKAGIEVISYEEREVMNNRMLIVLAAVDELMTN